MVLDPPEVRDAVVRRLRAAAGGSGARDAVSGRRAGPAGPAAGPAAVAARAPGVRVADAAAAFAISQDAAERDLELLFVCGLPGHGPGDLIDISCEGDAITLSSPPASPARCG